MYKKIAGIALLFGCCAASALRGPVDDQNIPNLGHCMSDEDAAAVSHVVSIGMKEKDIARLLRIQSYPFRESFLAQYPALHQMIQLVNESIGSTLRKYPGRVGRRSDEEYETIRRELYDGVRAVVSDSPVLTRIDRAVAVNLVRKEIPEIIEQKMELVIQLESCGYNCYVNLDS